MTTTTRSHGPPPDTLVSTGVPGLDDVLAGGLTPNRLYLLEGVPGSGKTTLAMQFLMAGVRRDEPVLYVTFSESEDGLRGVAASHGWSHEGITIRELVPSEDRLRPDDQYTLFHPSEGEPGETIKAVIADVERVKPARVVFDSLPALRRLAGDPLRHRRQILAFKRFFSGRNCTVLLLDDMTGTDHDLQVQRIAHGVVRLEQTFPDHGAARRRLIVLKHRGRQFLGGYHDCVIRPGGLVVYPRPVASEHRPSIGAEQLELAMAAAHAGSWQVDLATGEFSASDRAIELHGLPAGSRLNHERALASVHPDDRVGIEAALRLAFESGQPFRHEYRVPQPDGSVRWMSSQAERRGEGAQACVIGLVQDVTDRKQAEEALRASEDRFRLAADAVNGIIYEWDILTGHIERQRGLYEVVGYRPDEVPPTAAWWLEQIHPDDREPARRQFEQAAASGNRVVAECRVRHRDGRWLHVEDRGVLQRGDDGQPIKMVGCTVDVTAQKQADAERRRRETFTSGILGSITDGFGVVCNDWRFTFANDELVRRFGKQRDGILGSALWEMLPGAVGNPAYVQLHRAMADRVAVEYEVYYEPWQRWFLDKAFPTADGGLAVYSRDITERKRDEGERRLLASIVENSRDFIGISDTQGNPVYGNRAAMELVGLEDLEQVRLSKIVDYFIPEQRQFVAEVVLPAVATKGRWSGELTMQHFGTGATFPVWYDVFRVDDRVTGRPVNFATITRDLTESKRVEKVLAEKTHFLERIAEITPGVLHVYDLAEKRAVFINRSVTSLLGYSSEEAQAMGEELVPSLVHPEDLPRFEQHLARVCALADGESAETEHRMRDRTGAWHWFLGHDAVFKRDAAGTARQLIGVASEITARKQAEQALADRTELLNGVLESTTDVIFVKDLNGRLLLANAAFAAAARSTPEQLVGKTDADWFPPDVAAAVRQHDAAVIAGGSPVQVEETVPVAGEARVYLTLKTPLRDGGGRVVGVLGISRDITERKRAEAALQTSEQRFRTLFESMDEGFCVVEMAFDEAGRARDYRVLEMNPAFEKHMGRSGLIGKSVRQAIPDLEEFWYETYGRVAATGEAARFVRAAGPMGGRWFDVYAFRLGAAGSNKVAILFNDITDSRHVQETLRASEARNSFLVALSDTLRPLSDPTTVQAEAGRVLGERLGASRVFYFRVRSDDYVIEQDYTNAALSMVGTYPITSFGPNPLAVLRTGCTATEADVAALPARTPEEKAAFAGLQIRSYIAVPLVKGGTFVAGLAVHADSVRAWTPIEIAMTEDTAERTWAAVERVRAEAALRASEQQRRLALDAAELGMWHVDVATRLIKTDARFRAICGTSEAWTDYLQLFAVIHPDDLPAVEQAVAAATRPDDPTPYAIEHRVVHPDGAVRWVFAKGRTTHEVQAGKSVFSFDGTAMDITARKLIEQERERLLAQLRDADRHKDEFLATLAHELRNPLAPLRNGLQMIRLAGANGTVERARSMMDRQLAQLVRLVDDLMDVSRVTSGKLELRKERVELRAVIDAAVETSQPAIEQAGHELTVVVPDEPIVVDADATRLAQVVSNLLNNAAKYTHRGGHVRLKAWREDGTAVVSVEDDGIGIPPAMLGRVFEMFVQVDRALEKTTGGLGIGLSLAKGLVEMHGGTIEARSDGEGMGSEFVVRMPVAMAVVAGADRLSEQDGETVPSVLRRILVVDDNVDAADSLGQLLELLGNEVRTANDGQAGIEVAAQFRPDVVLMDIGMPKLNGYEAARRIRQQPWGRAMVLVALTGWGQEDDRKKSADAGFDHHLVKPVDVDALMDLMSSMKCVGVGVGVASAAALPGVASS